MSRWLLRVPFGALALVSVALVARAAMSHGVESHSTSALPMPAASDGFAEENARAMDKMMAAMGITPSGNDDRDFVAMMVPHHQGAIDMALAELRHGKDETLRRMAQEIIVEQQQEITAMRLAADKIAAGQPLAPMALDICRNRLIHPQRTSFQPVQGEL